MESGFIDRLFGEIERQEIRKTRFYSDIGISRTTIMNWKRGAVPACDTFLRICRYLNVSPYYLWYGEEEAENQKEMMEKAKRYDAISYIVGK